MADKKNENDKPKIGDVLGKIAKTAKKANDIAGAPKKVAPKRTTVAANGSSAKKKSAAKKVETSAFDDMSDTAKSVSKDYKEISESFGNVFDGSGDNGDENKAESIIDLVGDVGKSVKKNKNKISKTKKKLKKSNKIQIAIIVIAVILLLSVLMVYVFSRDTFNWVIDAVYTAFTDDGYGDNYEMFYDEDGSVEVYFIDVGQGDSIFIKFPNKQTMLIDGGDNKSSVERSVKTALDQMNIKLIDYLMLTHTDSDHVGTLDYVVNNYEIGTFYIPGVLPSYKDAVPEKDKVKGTISTAAYYNFYTAATNETYTKDGKSEKSVVNKNIGTITILEVGTLKLTAYCPSEDYYAGISNRSSALDKNNMSPICILEFAGKKICFTGDADEDAEERFMADAENAIDIDVLKAGHHGSDTSSNPAFYDFVDPEYCVISVGTNNSYGHPKKEVLDRFSEGGDTVYRTDKNGTVKLTINGSGEIKFDTAKAA